MRNSKKAQKQCSGYEIVVMVSFIIEAKVSPNRKCMKTRLFVPCLSNSRSFTVIKNISEKPIFPSILLCIINVAFSTLHKGSRFDYSVHSINSQWYVVCGMCEFISFFLSLSFVVFFSFSFVIPFNDLWLPIKCVTVSDGSHCHSTWLLILYCILFRWRRQFH